LSQFHLSPTNLFPGFEIQASHFGGGIRVRGDQSARQWRNIAKRHAKAQSTPREIFTPLFSFLNIFLTPWHSNRKTIKGCSGIPPFRSLRLGVMKGFGCVFYLGIAD
jgi:hypothetical protein